MIHQRFIYFVFIFLITGISVQSSINLETPITFTAGALITQVYKLHAKAVIQNSPKTPMEKLITQTEITLLLKEMTNRCVTALFPKTIAAAYNLGVQGSLAIDLYKAVAGESQQLYPANKAEYLTPVQALPNENLLSGKSFFTNLNYSFMHAVRGFSTALISQVLSASLVSRAVNQQQYPLIFKMMAIMTTLAFNEWFMEGIRYLSNTPPATPVEEVQFYNKMRSVGSKLFLIVDKTIESTGWLNNPMIFYGAALGLLAGLPPLHPEATIRVPLDKDQLSNIIITTLQRDKNYQYAVNLARSNPDACNAIAQDNAMRKHLEDLIYKAEVAIADQSVAAVRSINPTTNVVENSITQDFHYLTQLWHLINA